ncbi:MAG TPA: PilZ domain-containing protein [Acidiferrobacterales bacterium]|nr:PilZ domain-containing protein [Acidiferrobacterales bacterium]
MARISQPDNRWSPRRQVDLDITLHVSGQFPFSGVVRNMSLGGLFVETDATRLVGDVEVYLGFTIRTNTGTHRHRVPARSSRQNGNGVALLFTALDTGASHDLRQLLYPAPVLAPAPASSHTTLLRPTG